MLCGVRVSNSSLSSRLKAFVTFVMASTLHGTCAQAFGLWLSHSVCKVLFTIFFSLTLHRKFGRRTPTEPCLLFSAGVM